MWHSNGNMVAACIVAYVVAVFLVVMVFLVAQIIVNLIEYIALAFLHKYFTSKENVNLPDLNRIV